MDIGDVEPGGRQLEPCRGAPAAGRDRRRPAVGQGGEHRGGAGDRRGAIRPARQLGAEQRAEAVLEPRDLIGPRAAPEPLAEDLLGDA